MCDVWLCNEYPMLNEQTVTNSAHFVSTVSNETILDNEIMVYERAKRLVTEPSVISRGRRKNICHLFWFLIVILFLSCRNSPRPENLATVPNPQTSLKLLRFYLMSKVCPNSFAVAYNNKAYALFSSRRLR